MIKRIDLVIYGLLIAIVCIIAYMFFHDNNVSITKIELDKKDISIYVGEKSIIKPTILPQNATSKTIKWKSNNPSVVKVDNNGVISGISQGEADIIISINDEKIKNSCHVKVLIHEVERIQLSTTSMSLKVDEIKKINAIVLPENTPYKKINYRSSDSSIVTVDTNGNVKGVKEGSAEIIVTDEKEKVDERCKVVVNQEVVSQEVETPTVTKKNIEKIELNKTSMELIVGKTTSLSVLITPVDADNKKVVWKSSNPSVVAVNQKGQIHAYKSGTVVITVTSKDGNKEASCVVTSLIPVRGIKILSKIKLKLKEGETSDIKVSVVPSDATNSNVSFESSNSQVAQVTQDGKIKAISKGTTTIIVKSQDGDYKKTITITVSAKTDVISVKDHGKIWGYNATEVVTPTIMEANFFTNLAKSGKGTFSNNIYTLNTQDGVYSYNVSNSTLNYNGHSSLIRIYYPSGKDLSSVNTFTFFGGSGEANFGSYFNAILNDPTHIKSSGIVILVSYSNNYNYLDGVYATNFVKQIVNQKSSVKNAIGGYSKGGPFAADAFEYGNYNKLFIIDSYFEKVSERKKLANQELVFFSPSSDSMYKYTSKTLSEIKAANYKNVTIITNNSDIINTYSNIFKIDNPGADMGYGHGYILITNANLFAYACS